MLTKPALWVTKVTEKAIVLSRSRPLPLTQLLQVGRRKQEDFPFSCQTWYYKDCSVSRKTNVEVKVEKIDLLLHHAASMQQTLISTDFLVQMRENANPKFSWANSFCELSPELEIERKKETILGIGIKIIGEFINF